MKTAENRKKVNRALLYFGCIAVYSIIIFIIIPVYESMTPVLLEMEGVLYSGEGITEPAYGLAFWGSNLDDIDMVYIDGTANESCQIREDSDNKVVVDIPQEIYQGREFFKIQVSKRVGGIYNCKGETYEVQVAEYMKDMPKIISLSNDVVYRTQKIQNIYISMEDIAESKVYVNGSEVPSIVHEDEGFLEVSISSDMYDGRDCIEIMPVIEIGRGQLLYGNTVEVRVEDMEKIQFEHSCELAEKNAVILQVTDVGEEFTGTGSREAFLHYYEKGCRAFKMELFVTSDGVLTGCYDWPAEAYGTEPSAEYRKNKLPKTYEELCEDGQTPLRWEEMLGYMALDPELYFVIGTKYDNEQAIEYVFGKMVEEAKAQGQEAVLERVAIEFGNQDMYQKIMEVFPFSTVMYALTQSAENREEVLEFIENSNVRMITLEQGSSWDQNVFLQELLQYDCYVYVRTVDSVLQALEYMEKGYWGICSDSITTEQMTDAEEIEREQERNKQFLVNYLREIKNENYLVFMSIQDEATASVDDDIAQALTELGVSEDYRHAYRQSYLGIMSGGNKIYETFSDELLEYEYTDGKNLFQMKSAGAGIEEVAGTIVNGEEKNIYERGLHITVFNKLLGIVQDRIVFDLYGDLGHINY